MSELLISIGITEYYNKIFTKLPGAKNDAIRISSFFKLWGIESNNIITLIDNEATKERILDAIRIESLRKEVDTIFIYYAGHGEINEEDPRQPENILYCYDTSPSDKVRTGLKIKEIIDGIQRCKPLKVFLFIDACCVQLMDFPAFYLEPTYFDEDEKCFFALLSTCGKPTYETINGGTFTTLLLQGIACLRSKNTVCLDLAAFVENRSYKLNLPRPKGYWIGNSNVGLLESLTPNYMCELKGNKYVNRYDSLVSITDEIILKNNNQSIFCFYGKAKSGKTIIALELEEYFPNYAYYSIERYHSMDQIKSEIANLIYSLVKDSNIKLNIPCNDLNCAIKLTKLSGLNLSIVLDHAERLEQHQLDSILEDLSINNIIIIAFSRVPLSSTKHSICNCQHPDFSKNEFAKFLELHEFYLSVEKTSFYYDIYKSNPQELVQSLLEKSPYDVFVNCEKEITCICQCNGFVNINLFSNTFGLKDENIFKLINYGLIRKESDHYLPHESLFDHFNLDKNSVLTSVAAEKYWISELINSPTNEYTCTLFVTLIENKNGDWLGNSKYMILKILVFFFMNRFDWRCLEKIYPLLIANQFFDLLIKVSTQLAHVGNEIILVEDDKIYSSLPFVYQEEWRIIKSEVLFWKGNFPECIEISKSLLFNEFQNTTSYEKVKLNLGISYFFIGEWDLALKELNDINLCKKRTLGWKKLILGTIYAIRGVDFKNGINFLYDSISILEKINDVIGLSIAYVNLGECLYKKGVYDTANYYLNLSEKLAIVSHDDATLLEVLKNKLLSYLLKNHTFDGEAISLEKQILTLLKTIKDKTELMQVYNVLAVSAAYNYNVSALKKYTNMAKELTIGNLEYELYTSINKIIITYIENDFKVLECNINSFYELANLGKNFFAIKQCINIVKDIQHLYQLPDILCEQWTSMKGEYEYAE